MTNKNIITQKKSIKVYSYRDSRQNSGRVSAVVAAFITAAAFTFIVIKTNSDKSVVKWIQSRSEKIGIRNPPPANNKINISYSEKEWSDFIDEKNLLSNSSIAVSEAKARKTQILAAKKLKTPLQINDPKNKPKKLKQSTKRTKNLAATSLPRKIAPKPRKKEESITMATFAQAISSGRTKNTIGPLNYSQKDLSKCEVRCSLSMQDKAGEKLEIIFFKVFAHFSYRGSFTHTIHSRDNDYIRFRISSFS